MNAGRPWACWTVCLMIVLSACTPATEETTMQQVRTDPEPISKRFPSLGRFTAVHWLGGTDDGRVPGPTTYTIEAVITLAPDDARRLAADFDLGPAAPPAAPAPLASYLGGETTWSAAEELDQALSRESLWNADVTLDVDGGRAYLSAEGRR